MWRADDDEFGSLTACRSEAAWYSGLTAEDTSVPFGRWPQGEQTDAGWVLSLSVL